MAKFNADDAEVYMSRAGGVFKRAPLFIVGGVILLILLFNSVVRIDTGHVGVVTFFSKVTGVVLPEGLHMISPLNAVHEMSVQTETLKETADVPSNEGLILRLDTSLQYRLDRDKASELFQKINMNYVEKVVEPNLRSAVREVTASHNANALSTGAREEVAQKIQEALERNLAPQGIIVERVLLRDVQLPAMLKSSIEAKQQAEQDALRMTFILQKEKQEAERKRIEAQGIADFQKIVAQGISPQLLEWKGIEATEKLAMSTNTKIVMIGNSKSGLPIIFEPK